MNQHSLKTEMEETVVQIRHKGNSLWQIIYIDLTPVIVVSGDSICRLGQRCITEGAQISTFAIWIDAITITFVDCLGRIWRQLYYLPETDAYIRLLMTLEKRKKFLTFF